MKLKDFFFDTSYQQILKFLSNNPNRTFFGREIAQKTGVSRGATNLALRKLAKAGLVTLEKKGRMSFYSVDLKNPVIRQWKVLDNIVALHPLKEKLKKMSEKIILFGSAAEGINIKESDIDLLLLTDQPGEVKEIVSKSNKKVQLIVKKPLEFVELKSKDQIFYNEVMKGITLWEKSS